MSADPIARGLAAMTRADAVKSANTRVLIAAIRGNGFHPSPTTRLAAANIPVIVVGAANANSVINGAAARSATVARTDSKLTYVAGVPIQTGPTFPRDGCFNSRGGFYGAADAGGTPLRGSGHFAYEFVHTGTTFEIPVYGGLGASGVNFRVLVNGAIGGSALVPNSTGSFYFVKVTFPSSGIRTIRVETAGLPTSGLHVASAGEVSASYRSYPLVTIVGDSFVEGSGAAVADAEASVLGRALGFNCAPAGVGAAGMVNPGNNNTNGFPKTNFTDATRLLDLTLAGVTSAQNGSAADPRLGVVFGSMNDQSATAPQYTLYGTTLQEAVTNRTHAMIDAWVAARAGRPLVFFGPTHPSGAPNNRPPVNSYLVRDGIAEAVWSRSAENVWFIDRFMPGLREGVWSTAADMASIYTGSDSTHPTPAGHRFDGLWQAGQLRRLILTEFA